MFVPAPGFFKNISLPPSDNHTNNVLIQKQQSESLKVRQKREDILYNEFEETQRINVAYGYVMFTKYFKYLGSYLSYSLRDDFNVKMRIVSASRVMGALHSFLKSTVIELYSKYLIFVAISLNLALYGCKS